MCVFSFLMFDWEKNFFMTSPRILVVDDEADLRELLGVPLRSLLNAEASFEYERPIVAGDRLLVTSRVAEVQERPSSTGKMEIAVLEDEGRDEEGRLVYRLRRTLVVRGSKESA